MWQIVYRRKIRHGVWTPWFLTGYNFADKEKAKAECRFRNWGNDTLQYGIQILCETKPKGSNWLVEGF